MPWYHGDGKSHVNERDFVDADSIRAELLMSCEHATPELVPLPLFRAASGYMDILLPLDRTRMLSQAFFPIEFIGSHIIFSRKVNTLNSNV